jgi:hypothetical protein
MMIKESGETRALTIAQLNELMAAMLREICLATYERRYGVPASDAIQKRVQAAHSMELKEWIPNLVAARHPEEIFTQPREAAVATHALALLKRRFGINLDATTSLEVLTEQLKVYGPRILGTNPSNGQGSSCGRCWNQRASALGAANRLVDLQAFGCAQGLNTSWFDNLALAPTAPVRIIACSGIWSGTRTSSPTAA